MPYCIQCGTQVGEAAAFCQQCGATQPGAAKPPGQALGGFKGVFDNITPRTLATMCYIPLVGWIACIVALAVERYQADRVVRFHAFQGLYLYVAWLVADWVFPFFHIHRLHLSIEALLKVGVIAAWIFMMIKTSQRQDYRLPIFGGLAERSVAEQR